MRKSCCQRARLGALSVLLAMGLYAPPAALAVETLTLLALFKDQALLHIDGENRMLAAGEVSPEGVALLEATSARAVIKVDGREEVLELGMVAHFPGGSGDVARGADEAEKLTMWEEDDGMFYASGGINGSPVRFLVDTGANTIAINRALAERLGIDYRNGQKGLATTASGVTPMYRVVLERVSVGEITLRQVQAGVLLGEQPEVPLLGMSFLGKLDMVREGERLELRRR